MNTPAGDGPGDKDRIRALEDRIGQLEAVIERLAPTGTDRQRITESSPVRESTSYDASRPRSNRRTAIKAAAAAGGAVLASTLAADRAAAVDGSDLVVGQSNTSAGGNTRILANAGGPFSSKNIFTAQDVNFGSAFPSAVGGFAAGNRVTNGVFAYTEGRTAASSTGHALIAWATPTARSHLLLQSTGGDPRSDDFEHRSGSFRSDLGGNLWFCTDSGMPGTWHKLAGRATAGAVHAIDPTRVYDSRLSGGALAAGANRVISVANGIDIDTGAVIKPDLVPSGARAILFNLAVVNTVGSGFIAATPGDAGTFGAATINWFASDQTLNNGSFAKLDTSRQIRVWAGGGNADFVFDITGYLL
ncbi:MAG: hypothetical protein HKN44_02620 [Ilumatobacter sp.]|nr:hypothetical protein [Ilumatobacter sp.]